MRKIRLETNDINDDNGLRKKLDTLMGFPDWYDKSSDNWLDMISVFDKQFGKNSRYQTEFFMIEVASSQTFKGRSAAQHDQLLRWVGQINKKYIDRIGRPVLGLMLVD